MGAITSKVADSADDASRNKWDDNILLPANSNIVGCISGVTKKYGCGMRFNDIAIPKSTPISSAFITFTAASSTSGANCLSKICAEAVDNAETFANDKVVFDTRFANVTDKITWNNIGEWTANSTYNSPELKTIIQLIINRAGWSSGNSIVIFWEDFDNLSVYVAGNYREAYSYNGSTTKAPVLNIIFSSAKGSNISKLIAVGMI